MIKVLHILDHSLPVQSGYAFRSQAILHAQQRQGLDPFAFTSPKHYESWNGAFSESEAIAGVRYYRASGIARKSCPLIHEFKLMLAVVKRLFPIIRHEKPNLLHAHSPVLNALPALFVGRMLHLPVVYEVRSLWEDAGVDQGTYTQGNWKYRLAKFLESLACSRANQVVALCEGLKQDLIGRGIPESRITVVPNGFDAHAFTKQSAGRISDRFPELKGKQVIGFFGSFFHWEGLDLLVRAMGRIVKTRGDTTLLLVGGGVAEKDLKNLVRENKLDENVVMRGWVSQSEVSMLYSLVDVLVYPRHSMRLTELVTPLKPLEAMAMGKAVIASDVGGHRELVEQGRTGFLFKAGDVDDLVRVLEKVLEDEDLRRTIAKGGEEWVRRERSWEKVTRAYQEVYRGVL